jgi:hypothetical protein
MSKIKLLYNPEYWSNLTAFFLEPIWDQYFIRTPIDSNTVYNSKSDLIFADFLTADKWITSWKEQGFRVVVDHTWDTWIKDKWASEDNQLVIRNYNWSWYNESLWYQALGYQNNIPMPYNNKTFLMLMNLPKKHRDMIYEKLRPILNEAIYSYHGRGISLQGSTDIDSGDPTWQRYINPDWYNATKFSVVVESNIDTIPIGHSEKSYKPMAFRHPTISWASPGLLKYLKNQGFETFDHCIDESYDRITDPNLRLSKVCAVITDTMTTLKTDPNYFQDTQTQNKLDHNYNLFYNTDMIQKRFKTEIIDNILEFAS